MEYEKIIALYIHGFNSAGFGTKVNWLRKYFYHVINPNLPLNTEKSINLLDYLVRNLKKDKNYGLNLVGSSQGGFYALYLANKYAIPTILINPMIKASLKMQNSKMELTNLKTGEKFIYKKDYCVYLKNLELYQSEIQNLKKKIFIYVDTGDDVIDWKKTEEFFKGFYFKKFQGGSHYFEHMKELIEDLKHITINNPFKLPI